MVYAHRLSYSWELSAPHKDYSANRIQFILSVCADHENITVRQGVTNPDKVAVSLHMTTQTETHPVVSGIDIEAVPKVLIFRTSNLISDNSTSGSS